MPWRSPAPPGRCALRPSTAQPPPQIARASRYSRCGYGEFSSPVRPCASHWQASSSSLKRSARRNASHSSSSFSTVSGRSSSARCTLVCCLQVMRASSMCAAGTRRREHNASTSDRPRDSCMTCLGHWSRGVVPLPRSCASTAKRTVIDASSSAARRRHSITCTPVSTSGCHFGGCGTPNSASTSGKITASAPQSRSTSKYTCGCDSPSARSVSCQTRSGTRADTSPAATMPRISSCVLSCTWKPIGRKARGEARHAQHAHRIFTERRAIHAAVHARRDPSARRRDR